MGKLDPGLVRAGSGSCFHQEEIGKGSLLIFVFFLFYGICFAKVQPWLEEIIASKGCKRKLFLNIVTGAMRGIDVNGKSGSRSRKRN